MELELEIKSVPVVKFFVNNGSSEMNINGTKENPITFTIKPGEDKILYVISILVDCLSNNAPDLGNFCGINALTNGLRLQANINNKDIVLTNWKTLYDIRLDTEAHVYFSDGLYRTRVPISLGGNSPTIKLDSVNNDTLNVYVQDELREFTSFTIKACVHEEMK